MLTEVITDVPEGAGPNSKYCVGFYEGDELVAVMDLIVGYPESDDAYIGWFMVDETLQGQGIGSGIFADVRAAMQAQGFDHLEVACPKSSESGMRFWSELGFTAKSEHQHRNGYTVVTLHRDI